MKLLKITVVDEEVYADGIAQGAFIGPKHIDANRLQTEYGINLEAEQFAHATDTIMKNFNLPAERYKPLRLCIVVAACEARRKDET